MKFVLIISFLLTSLMALAADKSTEVFTLDHQMSQNCEKKIKENLRFEKGISKIDVSLKDNTITIVYDSKKTDTEKIIQAFKKIGFTAFVVGSEKEAVEPAPCCSPQPSPCCEQQAAPCCR